MRDYNRNDRSGGGRGRGGGGFRGRDSGRREMHNAVCDECGKDCQVPFRPSGGKPIYCSDCFEKRDGGGSRRSGRRDSGGSGFGGRDDTNKKLLEQMVSVNKKLDRVLKVLEVNNKKGGEKKTKKADTETQEVSKDVGGKKGEKVKKSAKISIPKKENIKIAKTKEKKEVKPTPKEE